MRFPSMILRPRSRTAYNEKVNNITNWGEIIFNRLTVKGTPCIPDTRSERSLAGFIIFDHPKLLGQAVSDLKKWVEEGKVTNSQGETVVDTKFEDIPKTWDKLFHGGNQGKLITKLV